MTVYPKRVVNAALPAAQAVAALSDLQGRLHDTPSLWSWAQAAAPNGSGVYADLSRRGHNWKQTDAAKRPAVAANWRATGLNAWAYDGTALAIDGDFLLPCGTFSMVAAFDLDATVGTGDNVTRAVLGSRLTTSTRFLMGQQNRRLFMRPSGGTPSVLQSTANAVSTKYVGTWVYSTRTRTLAVRINGGAWTVNTTLSTPAAAANDITCQLGNHAAPGTGLAWKGGLAEVALFNSNLHSARYAETLAVAEGALAQRIGVTLP